MKRNLEVDPCMHLESDGCRLGRFKEDCSSKCPSFTVSILQLSGKDVASIREALTRAQGNRCKVCEKVLAGDACLDHHHIRRIKGSGQIRGVLCRSCNTYLGIIENRAARCGIAQKDIPKILASIIEYLNSPHFALLHPSEKPKEKKLTKVSYNRLKKHMTSIKARGLPPYPKSGRFLVSLQRLFALHNIEPEFYK